MYFRKYQVNLKVESFEAKKKVDLKIPKCVTHIDSSRMVRGYIFYTHWGQVALIEKWIALQVSH